MCICIYISGILFNLHLVAIPMFKRHIVENIFNLITCFLDALSGVTTIRCAKFMFVSTDGKTQWLDAIMASWFALNKPLSSRCCASGVCRIRLTLSSRMQLPYLKMGNGLKLSTSGVCTYVAKRSSSWIWMARCAQRRQIGGCTSIARSSFTSRVDTRLSSTRMPMCTLNRRRPSGGWSCSLLRQ